MSQLPAHPPPAEEHERAGEQAARGPGRPVGDHTAKRLKLLSAAIPVLAQEGYAGTSLRRVAQRAGHTTGAVTYYFANKQALLVAIADHLFDRFDTLLEARNLEHGLRQWLDWASTDSELWLAQFQLLAAARQEPAVAKTFEERYGRYRRAFASILERGQQRGRIRADIPAELLADQLSAMADGWMVGRPIEPERFEPQRIELLLDATLTLISPDRAISGASASPNAHETNSEANR